MPFSDSACKYMTRGLVLGLQRSRSIIREVATYKYATEQHTHWSNAVVPDGAVDAWCSEFDPWLFGSECESLMKEMADNREPTPVDLMNYLTVLGMQPRRHRDDPYTSGDSWGIKAILPQYTDNYHFHPHRVITDNDRRFGLPSAWTSIRD